MVFGVLLMIFSILEIVGGTIGIFVTGDVFAFDALVTGLIGLWASLIMKHTFERLEALEKDMDKVYRAVGNSYSDIVTHAYHMQNRVIDEQSRELRNMRRKKRPARLEAYIEDEEDDERIK